MIEYGYELVGNDYADTAEVPKGDNIWYRCTDCGKMISSVPDDNIGCECGNVFIDKDCWRLIVANTNKFEVLRRVH
jgi:hypothetical protein